MSSHVADIVDELIRLYDNLDQQSIEALGDLYTDDVTFTDPLHHVEGLDNLKQYFLNTIKGIDYCHFAFAERARQGDDVFVTWQMRLKHPKLAQGREIIVPGTSHLKLAEDKIYQQTDYYDAGAMLYEHVPVLGYVIEKIKTRVKSS
ncbi:MULTISPECIES: nuclear transport factor 2 family protein [Pseudidiomarina]|uniref:SnoaL-like domain n=2 Tax=Pseudidiomarina TaxID=2800384 RepID=A0A0K6GUS3_9GAMM|nr:MULTISPECIES: nuclear transport factor 2 family protein [Pseudidiomarina]MBR9906744.1 nuclear transport factor 2 family protein [Gammaproteobacteria bacterium]RUO46224.1 nuclear transport factor 2 family protein [Pseudidiomarina donghaiensis]CUA82536.1 SnoaL-like domain [Pseudidiomarina woesei]SFV24846.1 SnoaL-like domain-containing protein [Pseudidiomarina donghaiensis]